MVFGNGQKVINGCDIIDGICQNPDLIDPGVSKNVQILLSHFTFGSGGQNSCRIYYLEENSFACVLECTQYRYPIKSIT